MIRRLILLRHAKSARDAGVTDDHRRPLAPRGHRDAPRVAACLAARGWVPTAVESSDSLRTRQTWADMAGAFPGAVVRFRRSLYHAGIGEVQRIAGALPAEVACAMLIGHNPGWEGAVAWLSGIPVRMTTANAALLETEAATWADALGQRWRLVDVIRPKDL